MVSQIISETNVCFCVCFLFLVTTPHSQLLVVKQTFYYFEEGGLEAHSDGCMQQSGRLTYVVVSPGACRLRSRVAGFFRHSPRCRPAAPATWRCARAQSARRERGRVRWDKPDKRQRPQLRCPVWLQVAAAPAAGASATRSAHNCAALFA
jgi:hypothetical protein